MTQNVQKFLWKNIITYFDIPNTMVIDNGLQFTEQKLNEFMNDLNNKHMVIFIEHPQTNEQAEATNKVILGELKNGWLGQKEDGSRSSLWSYGHIFAPFSPPPKKRLFG